MYMKRKWERIFGWEWSPALQQSNIFLLLNIWFIILFTFLSV
jgi:hypothetical protein